LAAGDGCPVAEAIAENAAELIELLRRKNSADIDKAYSGDPFLQKRIHNILKFNNIVITDKTIQAAINKTFNGWELRKVRVLNSYSTLKKHTPEYLVIDFDDQGNLYDINFGIMESLYEHFVEKAAVGGDWGNRQVIIKFVEKYRTTFLARDIDMLDSLFAEEAVIIVGRVLHKNKLQDVSKYYNMLPDVKYFRYTKEEYINRQRRLFNSKNDLFVGYSTFDISQKNKQPTLYGISMRQDFSSTKYSDEGYLFLLVDFEPGLPQIYVRSWQPQTWTDTQLIKLSNFNIHK
jgi:hypothetical protein